MDKNRQGGAGAWVYQRKNRQGVPSTFSVYYRLEPGAKLHGKGGFTTREEAEALAADLKSKITGKRRTVGEALDAFKSDMEARGLRPESVRQIDQRLRRLMSDVLLAPLAVLTHRRADELYQALATSGECAVGTHHKFLESAKTWGAWIAHRRREWVKASPWADVEKIGERPDSRSESLRVDEARTFRDKALELAGEGDAGAVASLVALSCSLRPSEIVQLTARDVDDGGAVLWVDGARLKTKNTRRPVEIDDANLRALLVSLATGKGAADRLFPHDRDFVADSAKRIAAAAGVPPVDARALRRTFASLASRRGRSLDDLAFSMGHGADSQARTATRHYVAPGAKQSGVAARVLGVLDGGKAPAKHASK